MHALWVPSTVSAGLPQIGWFIIVINFSATPHSLELPFSVNGQWDDLLSDRINFRCFTSDPSIKSSLKFLRQTQWARHKVERLYLRSIRQWPDQ